MPVFEPQVSKIKMVILTKHGFENAVWWSPLNQNKRRSDLVVNAMIGRFQRHALFPNTNRLQFYENGLKIHDVRL